ncbi:MAG TPA: PQQ-binding-like beta-propeller repeat protein [Chryseolinea sp.]|nr:PQQ-binding-like beta-propeller repeat protein [Chryseolinea sp.]
MNGIRTAVCIVFLYLSACTKPEHNTWSVYRGDAANTAYSALEQINRDNVANLEVAWTFHTGDAEEGNHSTIQCNPIIADGLMYVTSPKLKLIALEPSTGKEVWRFDPFEGTQSSGVNRGVTYWESGTDKRVYFSAGPYLYARHAKDGTPVSDFGSAGKIDLREGLLREPSSLSVSSTSPGIIYKDLIIQGTALNDSWDAPPGFIRAYDVRTGKTVWTFHTIPQPGEPNYDTWTENAYKEVGGVNNWCGMSLDAKRGIVYIPTGSPSFDFYGGNRKGKNLYANCLLAIEVATGKLIWHYQLVHHDIWDYDLPAPPNLVTVKQNGKDVDAVAQVTKMGMVFVFNRETGEPIFPIEERPVPVSDVLGEEVWTTQPFPQKPAPFVRHRFTTEEVTDLTPESHQFVLGKLKGAKMGSIYMPHSAQGTVEFPGTRGGAEWGGAAVDPSTGIMYVNANEIPMLIRMRQIDTSGKEIYLADRGQRIYTMNNCTACHGGDRSGTNVYPSLIGIKSRKSEDQVASLLKTGKGQMPAFPNLSDDDKRALIAFLFDKKDINSKAAPVTDTADTKFRFVHDGWNLLTDQNGYPGVKPPWGTLNAIDLNSGEILWKVPLGEYLELKEKGIAPTGTQNLGGPAISAGGLIFIGASRDEYFRVFDQQSGKILWEYKLPATATATPSIYEVDGKQFVVVACGGGGKLGTPSSDTYVAFALKN